MCPYVRVYIGSLYFNLFNPVCRAAASLCEFAKQTKSLRVCEVIFYVSQKNVLRRRFYCARIVDAATDRMELTEALIYGVALSWRVNAIKSASVN